VHKTGLGSSAALTTSLVAALLVFLDICQPGNADGRRVIHNLAQTCHCYAQGKIGSGFDVSSAVTAGHAYRRFSPDVLDQFLAVGGQYIDHVSRIDIDICSPMSNKGKQPSIHSY
jgi:phosphomevalonate kinase